MVWFVTGVKPLFWRVQNFQPVAESHDRLSSERQPEKGGKTTHQNKLSCESTWGEEENKCLIDIWSDSLIIGVSAVLSEDEKERI